MLIERTNDSKSFAVWNEAEEIKIAGVASGGCRYNLMLLIYRWDY